MFNPFREPELRELLFERRIDWVLNRVLAPWRISMTERPIGVVRRSPSKTLGESLFVLRSSRLFSWNYLPSSTIVRFPSPIQWNLERSHRLCFFVGAIDGTTSCSRCARFPRSKESLVKYRLAEVLRQKRNYFCLLSCRWHREYILQLQTANLDDAGRPPPLRHPGLDGRDRTYTVRFAYGFESPRATQVHLP